MVKAALWLAEPSRWDQRVPTDPGTVLLSGTDAGRWGTAPWGHEKGKAGGQELGWLWIPHHQSNLLQELLAGMFQVIMGFSLAMEHVTKKF